MIRLVAQSCHAAWIPMPPVHEGQGNNMTSLFAVPVFDATVIVDGNELFKGKGSATHWAERLAVELGSAVTVQKIGTGWALCGQVDGTDCVWGIYGQRLKRIN
jgi:hypothetical protein